MWYATAWMSLAVLHHSRDILARLRIVLWFYYAILIGALHEYTKSHLEHGDEPETGHCFGKAIVCVSEPVDASAAVPCKRNLL